MNCWNIISESAVIFPVQINWPGRDWYNPTDGTCICYTDADGIIISASLYIVYLANCIRIVVVAGFMWFIYPCPSVCSMGHYGDVILSAVASQITSLAIVYSTVYSEAYQRSHQNSASLAFVLGIRRWLATSPKKWPVTWETFPFDDVIMTSG